MEISDNFEINRSTYSNWENGIVMIPIQMADRFSIFYDVKISYIFGLEQKNNLNYKIKGNELCYFIEEFI